ncbi:MAG: hypothetical protein ACI9FD_004043 [Gammaproteobacteria bacterium]
MNNHYWNELLVNDAFTNTHKNRYLAFDIDQGGLNNIRMVFEYAVVIAAITRRTLILPPAQPWYLINQARMGKAEGSTDLADVFELSAIDNAMPFLTTNEFCQTAAHHLKIPNQFLQQTFDETLEYDRLQEWRQWLLHNSEILDWNSYESLLCYPDIKRALRGPHMSDLYRANRKLRELTPRMLASPIIYLPSDNNHRSLGPVATMLATETEHLPRLCRRLLKHHVRYRDEVFAWAEKIRHWLQLDDFNAFHIRRNDFQYKQTRLDVDRIHSNVQSLISKDKPLYVATDETDPEFFRQLASFFKVPKVYTISDWLPRVDQDFPYVWEGLVEQAICARASRFIGTDLSTFSAYINRLRGYIQVADQGCYYHTIDYNDGIHEEMPFHGREYLRENPLFWQDC